MNDNQLLSTLTVGEFKELMRHFKKEEYFYTDLDGRKYQFNTPPGDNPYYTGPISGNNEPVKHVWQELKPYEHVRGGNCECTLCMQPTLKSVFTRNANGHSSQCTCPVCDPDYRPR